MKYQFTVDEGAFQGRSYFYFECEGKMELAGHYPYRNGSVNAELSALEKELEKKEGVKPLAKLEMEGREDLICLIVPFAEPTSLDMGTKYFFKADAPIKPEGQYLGERALYAYLPEDKFEKFLGMAEDNRLRNTVNKQKTC